MSWFNPPPLVKKPPPPAWLPPTVKPARVMAIVGVFSVVCGIILAAIGYGIASLFVRYVGFPGEIRLPITIIFGILGCLYGSFLAKLTIHAAKEASESPEPDV